MPGAGSCLDRNDHQKLNRLIQAIEQTAEQLERLNDNLENDD